MSKSCNQNMGYADPAPYPEIRVTKPNRYYAQLLMEDYAGAESEATAINQYIFHHFVTEKNDVTTMLKRIAITEMHHLDILAGLILALGGNPVFKVKGVNWNSSFVYYGYSLCTRLHADLKSEYVAIHNYNNRIRMIQDPYVQAVLERIVLDEHLHADYFKKAIRANCKQ